MVINFFNSLFVSLLTTIILKALYWVFKERFIKWYPKPIKSLDFTPRRDRILPYDPIYLLDDSGNYMLLNPGCGQGTSCYTDEIYIDISILKVGKHKLLLKSKSTGQKLRETVWSTSEIIKKFRDFIDSIPVDSYEKEQHKWSLPSVNITSFNQIQSFVIKRGQEFDDFLSQLA